MKAVLKLAAAAEAATGVIRVAFPPIVVSPLCGVGVAGFAEVVSRFGGIALTRMLVCGTMAARWGSGRTKCL